MVSIHSVQAHNHTNTHTHTYVCAMKTQKNSMVHAVTWTSRGCQHQICLRPPCWPYEAWGWINGCVLIDKREGGRRDWKGRAGGAAGREGQYPLVLTSKHRFLLQVNKCVWVCMWMCFHCGAYSPGSKILAGVHTFAPPPHTQAQYTGLSQRAEHSSD